MLFDRPAANEAPYSIGYTAERLEDGVWELEQHLQWTTTQKEDGTDLAAVRDNYISIGKIRNMVLR